MYALDLIRALPLALLPKRLWDSFDLPVANAAMASAFIVLFFGFGLGIRGYFDYLDRTRRDSKGVSIVEISELQNQGKLPDTPEVGAVPMGLAIIAPVAFAFFTPLGALATYLVLSSSLRIGAAWVDETHGDPLLTALDALARRLRGSHIQRNQRSARQRLEGADEPDRLYAGNWAGLPDVTYVVVAARRKPGWTKGTWVITGDGWFTLGDAFDRPSPNGLRTIYPLTLQTSTMEVLRKGVSYELPPLRKK